MESKTFNTSGLRPENMAQMDGVRGLMAVMIYSCHFFAVFTDVLPSYGYFHPFAWLVNSKLGLCYFFLLSGFVITYSQQKKQKRTNIFKYICKRFIRLLPPIFFSIIMMWLVMRYVGFLFGDIDSAWLNTLPYTNYSTSNMTNPFRDIFLNSYFGGTVYYNCNLWAIRFEFIVPVFIVLISPYLWNKYVRLAIFSVILLLGLFIEKNWFYFDCMLIGMLLCFLLCNTNICKKTNLILKIICATIFIMISFFPYALSRSLINNRLINLLATLILVVWIIRSHNKIKSQILNSWLIKLCGAISYEIYVFHLFFILTVGVFIFNMLNIFMSYNLSVVTAYMTVLVATVLFSFVFKRYISSPIMKNISKKI